MIAETWNESARYRNVFFTKLRTPSIAERTPPVFKSKLADSYQHSPVAMVTAYSISETALITKQNKIYYLLMWYKFLY